MQAPVALIIEDDPRLSTIFSTALNAIGFETNIDQDGSRYKTLLETQKPDIILMDFHLPFVSGPEILQTLRSQDRWRDIPVILMTADLAKAKSFEGVVNKVLLKPVSINRIQEAVKDLVSG